MKCPNCQTQLQPNDAACSNCDFELPIRAEIVDAEIGNPYSAPVNETGPYAATGLQQTGDSTGGLIPYKNPKALIAYYLGIVSGLPFIGFPFAIAAVVLGIKGLRDRKKDPVIKGSVHAWVGIGCGSIFAILWGIAIVSVVIALLAG